MPRSVEDAGRRNRRRRRSGRRRRSASASAARARRPQRRRASPGDRPAKGTTTTAETSEAWCDIMPVPMIGVRMNRGAASRGAANGGRDQGGAFCDEGAVNNAITMPRGGKSARERGMPMKSRSRLAGDNRVCSTSPVAGSTADQPRPAPMRLGAIRSLISHRRINTGLGRRLPTRSMVFGKRAVKPAPTLITGICASRHLHVSTVRAAPLRAAAKPAYACEPFAIKNLCRHGFEPVEGWV